MTRTPSVVAVHEAGHAVGNVIHGVAFKGVRVHRNRRTGHTYGTYRQLDYGTESTELLYSRAVSALAGPYAEAKYSHRSRALVLLAGGGAGDYKQCELIVSALAWRLGNSEMWWGNGGTDSYREFESPREVVEYEVDCMTRKFVGDQWRSIIDVANAVDAVGFLSAAQVREIVASSA